MTTTTNFTPIQMQVIDLLAVGQSVTAAAAACHLDRTTIHHWSRTNPDFNDAVRDAQTDAAAIKRDLYLAYVAEALAILLAIMRDSKNSASIRLKAALHILKEAAAPAPKPQTKQERRDARLLRMGIDPQTEPANYNEFVSHQQTKDQAMIDQLGEIVAAEREQQPQQSRQKQQQQTQPQNSSKFTTPTQPAPAPAPAQAAAPAVELSEFITGSAESDAAYAAILLPAAQSGLDEFLQAATECGLSPKQTHQFICAIEAGLAAREAAVSDKQQQT